MINDKIRAGAQMLVLADANINDKAYNRALKSAAPEENLRAMFLADLMDGHQGSAVRTYWGFLHTRIHENDFQMTPEVQMLVDVLSDEDLLSKADRAACAAYVKKEILVGCVHNEIGMKIIESAFDLDYDRDTAKEMWKAALHGTADGAARMAKRADPSDMHPFDLARSATMPEACEVYAQCLSDQRLREAIQELRDVAASGGTSGDKAWKVAEAAPLSSVLVAEHVRRHGVADGVAQGFFDQFINDNYRLTDKFNRFVPQLLRVAEALGRLDDERLYRYLVEGSVNHVEPQELARLLRNGLPAQRAVSHPSGGAPLHFLVDGATLDRVGAIANAMTPQERETYLERGFAERASEISQLWANKKSVLDPNIIISLYEAGFDVARRRVGEGDKLRWPHEAFTLFQTVSRPVFTCLHALGVYPRDLRLDDLSPMHLAALHNDAKAIRALAALGYDIDEPAGPNAKPGDDRVKQAGNTPLVMALLYKHRDAMEVLIELGADVGVKAATGASLMQLAKDEDTKRLIRAARTGGVVAKAMSEGQQQLPSVSAHQPGVL